MRMSRNDLRESVTSVCVRLSKVSKVEGEKVPSGHRNRDGLLFLGIEQSLNFI